MKCAITRCRDDKRIEAMPSPWTKPMPVINSGNDDMIGGKTEPLRLEMIFTGMKTPDCGGVAWSDRRKWLSTAGEVE